MPYLSKQLLVTTGFVLAGAFAPLSFAQAQSADLSVPQSATENIDAQKAADIALWESRLTSIVEYIETNDLSAYRVSEAEYKSNNIDELIETAMLVKKQNRVGDFERLVNRITYLAERDQDEQALKLVEILKITKSANHINIFPMLEKLNAYANDTDWLVSLMARYSVRVLSVTFDDFAASRPNNTSAMMIPSQSADRYELGAIILDEMKSYEDNVQLNAEGSYESILRLIIKAQAEGETAPILVELQNLIDILVYEYGADSFLSISQRLIEIDFPDPQRAQAIILHYNAYAPIVEPVAAQKILEEAIELAPPDSLMSQVARLQLTIIGLKLDDRSVIERYKDNLYYKRHLQTQNTIEEYSLLQVYLGEISFEEAVSQIEAKRRRNFYRRRLALGKEISPFEKTDLRFKDGLAEIVQPSLQTQPAPKSVMFSLTQGQVESLETTLDRLTIVNKLAEKAPFKGARLSEYIEGANIEKVSNTDESRAYLETLGVNNRDLKTLDFGRENPIYLSSLRKGFSERPVSLTTEFQNASKIESAYQNLLEIKLELRVGQVDSTWDRLKRLSRTDGLSAKERSHLSFDILLTEAELLFLEGNTPALIAHLSDITREAVQLNRRVNAENLMILLAISLERDGYHAQTARVVDVFLENQTLNQCPEFILMYLQGKVLISQGELEKAEAIISEGVDVADTPEDGAILLAELLELYNAETKVEKIAETRTRLLNRIGSDGHEALVESFRPVLTRSSYVLDKHSGIDTSASYAAYFDAQNKWTETEQNRKSNLSVRRISAERDALIHATTALESAQAFQAKRENRYKLLFALIAVLSVLSAAVLYRSRKVARLALASEARTLKMRRLYNRTLKDDYYQTKRLLSRIQQQVARIIPRVDDIRDEQMLELIVEDVEAHEQTITKNSFLRRIQADDQSPVPSQMSLHLFVQTSKAYWEKQVLGTDLKVVVKSQSNLPDIFLDEHYLNIVITEMMQRALDHTVFGVIELCIFYNQSAENIIIMVRDTGHGSQDSNTDYHLTENAVKALGGRLKFIKSEKFAFIVEVECPAPTVKYFKASNIEVSSPLRIVSTNDR